MENVEFLLLLERKRKQWEWTILPLMESDDFPIFLVSCPWKFPRISPGQVQNYQLLGGLLVSVKSIEKVQKYCNWRKEALFRL